MKRLTFLFLLAAAFLGNFCRAETSPVVLYDSYRESDGYPILLSEEILVKLGELWTPIRRGASEEQITLDSAPGEPGSAPVFAVYNPNLALDLGNIYYTMNSHEYRILLELGYRDLGVVGEARPERNCRHSISKKDENPFLLRGATPNRSRIYHIYFVKTGRHLFKTWQSHHWDDIERFWRRGEVQFHSPLGCGRQGE